MSSRRVRGAGGAGQLRQAMEKEEGHNVQPPLEKRLVIVSRGCDEGRGIQELSGRNCVVQVAGTTEMSLSCHEDKANGLTRL